MRTDLFSLDLKDRDNKFYYPENIINRFNKKVTETIVNVYNLCDIIDKTFNSNEVIDFIKIDAEGKDLDIVKSLKEYLPRIKYIGIECSSYDNNNLRIFENGSNKQDAITFFEKNNFSIFEIIDYSKINLTQASDIIFKNLNF